MLYHIARVKCIIVNNMPTFLFRNHHLKHNNNETTAVLLQSQSSGLVPVPK